MFSLSVFEIVKNPKNVGLVCGSKASNEVQQNRKKDSYFFSCGSGTTEILCHPEMGVARNHLYVASMKNVIEQYFTLPPPFRHLFWSKVLVIGFSNKWLCILLYNFIEVNLINFLQWLAHKIKECWAVVGFFSEVTHSYTTM